jgi:hypothetical protein
MRTRFLVTGLILPSVLVLVALSHTSGDSVSGANGLINGGFESVSTDGWTTAIPTGGFVEVVGSFGAADPVEGSFFALMKTDGPGSFTTLSQSFFALPGDRLVGSARFFDGDCAPFVDTSDVALLSGSSVVATLFAEQSCPPDLGWQSWNFLITSAGNYTIRARITNGVDSIFDSLLGVDGVSLIQAPTPTAVPPTPEPTRVRTNVGGAAAAVVGAISDQAQENRERAAAAAAPQATVAPPRTGTGVTIAPPSTGDAGLASSPSGVLWPLVAAAAGLVGAASLALARRR